MGLWRSSSSISPKIFLLQMMWNLSLCIEIVRYNGSSWVKFLRFDIRWCDCFCFFITTNSYSNIKSIFSAYFAYLWLKSVHGLTDMLCSPGLFCTKITYLISYAGIWAGMRTVRYFDGKTYEWVGISRQPNIMGKVYPVNCYIGRIWFRGISDILSCVIQVPYS